MAAPLNTCTTIEQRSVVLFLWVKWQQRISTKKCCPCTINIACHVKQSSKTTSLGGTLSWQWRGWKNSVGVVQTAATRILRRRFPGTCEMVGQVFKFVWRLRWKINVVCMSLSPFVSFQSRFVTYLLTYPRIIHFIRRWITCNFKFRVPIHITQSTKNVSLSFQCHVCEGQDI